MSNSPKYHQRKRPRTLEGLSGPTWIHTDIMPTFKPTLIKEYFAYLVNDDREVQFVWTDESNSIVSLSFYHGGRLMNVNTKTKSEAREFWIAIVKRGYTIGVKCSTHLVK